MNLLPHKYQHMRYRHVFGTILFKSLLNGVIFKSENILNEPDLDNTSEGKIKREKRGFG
jgi:hypothetical protein